jgi:DNA-directed RNA polymerase subunit M/transcription elongation factor TFIIS
MDNTSMKSLDNFFRESSLFREDRLRKKPRLPLLDEDKNDVKDNSICCPRCNNAKYIELKRLQIRKSDEEATLAYYCSNCKSVI